MALPLICYAVSQYDTLHCAYSLKGKKTLTRKFARMNSTDECGRGINALAQLSYNEIQSINFRFQRFAFRHRLSELLLPIIFFYTRFRRIKKIRQRMEIRDDDRHRRGVLVKTARQKGMESAMLHERRRYWIMDVALGSKQKIANILAYRQFSSVMQNLFHLQLDIMRDGGVAHTSLSNSILLFATN